MGIIGGGCETMRYAWPKLLLKFSIRENNETVPDDLKDPPYLRYGSHREWPKLLTQHPVDLLVIERGTHKRPNARPRAEPWETTVGSTTPAHQPNVVIETW